MVAIGLLLFMAAGIAGAASKSYGTAAMSGAGIGFAASVIDMNWGSGGDDLLTATFFLGLWATFAHGCYSKPD